jgi:tetratricopeptide (TPR) repeat protein
MEDLDLQQIPFSPLSMDTRSVVIALALGITTAAAAQENTLLLPSPFLEGRSASALKTGRIPSDPDNKTYQPYALILEEPTRANEREAFIQERTAAGWNPVRSVRISGAPSRSTFLTFGHFPTPMDAQLASAYFDTDAVTITTRPLATTIYQGDRFGSNARPPVAPLTAHPIAPGVTETSETIPHIVPGLVAFNLRTPWTTQTVTRFQESLSPIMLGGQRNGALIEPQNDQLVAEIIGYRKSIEAGALPPENLLEHLRHYLLTQKDVRPAIPLLEALALHRIAATPDTRYQAAWLLARTHHARADRYSALQVYNSLIQASPFPGDRALALAERLGLMIELEVDDQIANTNDWMSGAIHAKAIMEPLTPETARGNSILDYLIFHYCQPENPTTATRLANISNFISLYEDFPQTDRTVSRARGYRIQLLSQDPTPSAKAQRLNDLRLIVHAESAIENHITNLISLVYWIQELAQAEQEEGNFQTAMELKKRIIELYAAHPKMNDRQALDLGQPGVSKTFRRVLGD